jgi:protein gp37
VSSSSTIEWTDATWNPTRGCDKVSAGCKHCYAETFAERWRGVPGHAYERGFDLRLAPKQLPLPLSWKTPRRVFVNSMSDLFHEGVPDEYIAAVFGVMAAAPQHTFQVLTKRAERLPRWFESLGADPIRRIANAAENLQVPIFARRRDGRSPWNDCLCVWPLPNAWIGVSAENQETADDRIPHLLATPAAVRFVSAEPLLGPIDLRRITLAKPEPPNVPGAYLDALTGHVAGPDDVLDAKLDWVIVGGESGSRARPFDLAWARSIVGQCRAAGTPVFVKQLGGDPVQSSTAASEHGSLFYLKSRKGGDPSEWPEDLRVREFPR